METSKIIEFNKRFANGEQYLAITNQGNLENIEKLYFWQSKEVYNHIEPILNAIRCKIKNQDIKYTEKQFEDYFYKENGLVSLLIPTQRAYNTLKNKKIEFINRLTYGVLMVEDGSVDTDSLEEEGLYCGKVLVYRQGSNKPTIVDENVEKYKVYDNEENRLLQEFTIISGDLDFRTFEFIEWLKENN